jgi:hypothetical protein
MKLSFAVVFVLSLLVTLSPPVQEQPELQLRMSRTWGYSSGSGKIQGLFTMKASGPDDLQRVTFYIDGTPLGEATQSPFELRLNTDEHSLGIHTLYAVGVRGSGHELHSNEIRVVFVSADESWQAARRIMLPLFAIVFGAILLSFLLTFLTAGKRRSLPPGAPRKYGFSGGAICPKCQRPFPLHLFGLNLGLGKLDRCPYCGKWSVLRPRPIGELRLAEQAELEASQAEAQVPEASDEAKLRRDMDDSRFQDL